MGHKVDISEVNEFLHDLQTAALDLKSSLSEVEKSIDRLDAMRSFSGKTATEAKNYFHVFHKTLLKAFENLFTDLDEHLKNHLNSFQYRVDSNEFAIVESDYLMDIEKDINDNNDRLDDEKELVRETIASVSDISNANHPSTISLHSDYRAVTKIRTNLEKSLDSFTSAGRQEISETGKLLHHLEQAITNAGAVAEDARFTDYKGNSLTVGLPVLKAYNEKIHQAVIDEAREAKEVAVKNMDEASQEILVKALKDLENERIDETQYYEYLAELKKLQSEVDSDEEVSSNFIKYVMDNFDDVTDDSGENTIAAYIKQSFTDASTDRINRAKLVEAMSGNRPSSTSNFLKRSGNRMLNVGRAVGGALTALTVGVGTYIDYQNTDKTAGEAFTKNATEGGIGLAVGGIGYGVVHGIVVFLGASTPVGWAIAVTGFKYVYDNNFLRVKDGLDWAGQQIDKAGQQINKGLNWVEDKVNDGLNKIGKAFTSGLDAINLFS